MPDTAVAVGEALIDIVQHESGSPTICTTVA
jgi:hypothetical protein